MSVSLLGLRLAPRIAAGASLLCAVGGGVARAAETPLHDGAPSDGHRLEHAHFHNAFVLKIAHVETRTMVAPRRAVQDEVEAGEENEAGGVERRSALGITFEHVLLEGWLNAEVGTLLSSEPGGKLAFPSTLLLKVPAEFAEAVEGYLGAGVAVELDRDEQWTPNWGAAAALGLYVWVAPETGFNLDFEQSFLLGEGVIAELALGAGVVTRF